MRPRPSFKIDFEDGSSATLCLADPGSSVAVRDKNHAVEYLGLDPGLSFARERPCPHRLVDVGDGPRHSNRWTCAFLRPSSSLKSRPSSDARPPRLFEFKRCGISKWEAPWSLKPMALVLRVFLKLFSQTVLQETGFVSNGLVQLGRNIGGLRGRVVDRKLKMT